MLTLRPANSKDFGVAGCPDCFGRRPAAPQQSAMTDDTRFTRTRLPAEQGWTKQQLMQAADLSGKTFDTIRKAARVKGPSHGGLGYIFDDQDLFALIAKTESGRFSQLGPPVARAWRALLAEAGVQMPEVISRSRR
jgi:hypothetical protein